MGILPSVFLPQLFAHDCEWAAITAVSDKTNGPHSICRNYNVNATNALDLQDEIAAVEGGIFADYVGGMGGRIKLLVAANDVDKARRDCLRLH